MSRGPEKWYGNLHWEPYHLKKWYGFGRVCRIGSGAIVATVFYSQAHCVCIGLWYETARSPAITEIDRVTYLWIMIRLCDSWGVFSKQPYCNRLASTSSANNCLTGCLYNDGLVQAVSFAYLIYWSSFLYSPRAYVVPVHESNQQGLKTQGACDFGGSE